MLITGGEKIDYYHYYLLILIASISLTACTSTTRSLWEQERYSESIYQFLAYEKDDTLILRSLHYDYIFTNEKSLIKVLNWHDKSRLKLEFEKDFTLDTNNQVHGYYRITCYCDNTSDTELEWLRSNGFKPSTNSDSSYKLIKQGKLSGKRYLSQVSPNHTINELPNSTQFNIRLSPTAGETAENIALSPLAITADAINTVNLLVFLYVATPILIADSLLPDPTITETVESCLPCYDTQGFERQSPFLEKR